MIRLARAPLGPSVRLDRASFSMSFSARGDPLDALHVNHLRSGQARYDPGSRERSYGPGDVFLAVQPGRPYATQSHDADIEVTVIDPALLSQVAGTGPGGAGPPVRLTGYDPVSAQAAGEWKNTLTYVRDTVLASPDAAAMPLLVSTAARLLAAATLAAFPSNAFTEPTSTDRHDAHRGTVRRAVTFIDEHAHTDITIADIAAAARVTIRAVQLAFRRHLDTTPTAYLRRVRLEHAHRQLQAAGPATTTITDVAYRWGFSNATRFAAYYRQAYGVPPSHTLRQGS
jgi:AraC-like DNA-binding protein